MAARPGGAARPLPVLAAGLVDVPVGASAHFAALVLEQVLHPLTLGRQLRLELVVHVSPMGGEGTGKGRGGRISTPGWRSPLPAPPFPGLDGGGGRGGGEGAGGGGGVWGGGGGLFLFWFGAFWRGEGVRSAATRFNWATGGAARGMPGVVVRLRAPAPAPPARRWWRQNYNSRHAPGRPGQAASAHSAPQRHRAFQRPLGTC